MNLLSKFQNSQDFIVKAHEDQKPTSAYDYRLQPNTFSAILIMEVTRETYRTHPAPDSQPKDFVIWREKGLKTLLDL